MSPDAQRSELRGRGWPRSVADRFRGAALDALHSAVCLDPDGERISTVGLAAALGVEDLETVEGLRALSIGPERREERAAVANLLGLPIGTVARCFGWEPIQR